MDNLKYFTIIINYIILYSALVMKAGQTITTTITMYYDATITTMTTNIGVLCKRLMSTSLLLKLYFFVTRTINNLIGTDENKTGTIIHRLSLS